MRSSRENIFVSGTHKVVFIGDMKVGKTAILRRLKGDGFKDKYEATDVSAAVQVRVDNKNSLYIVDAQGLGKASTLRVVRPSYIDTDAYVFVYDATNKRSFERLPWETRYIRNKDSVDSPMILLGSKSDLVDEREVSEQDVKSFAKKHDLIFYGEVSAKDDEKIKEFAPFLVGQLQKRLKQEQKSRENTQKLLTRVLGGSIGTVLGGVAAIGFTLAMAAIGPIGWAVIGIAAGLVVAGTVCGVLGADVVVEHQAARYEQKNDDKADGCSSSSDIYQGLGATPELTTNPANIAKAIEQSSNPYEDAYALSDEHTPSAQAATPSPNK